jgi:hypothetical protein
VARKLAALEAHRSQLRSTMRVQPGSGEEEAQLAAFRARVNERLATHGRIADVARGEAFKAITDL